MLLTISSSPNIFGLFVFYVCQQPCYTPTMLQLQHTKQSNIAISKLLKKLSSAPLLDWGHICALSLGLLRPKKAQPNREKRRPSKLWICCEWFSLALWTCWVFSSALIDPSSSGSCTLTCYRSTISVADLFATEKIVKKSYNNHCWSLKGIASPTSYYLNWMFSGKTSWINKIMPARLEY